MKGIGGKWTKDGTRRKVEEVEKQRGTSRKQQDGTRSLLVMVFSCGREKLWSLHLTPN